MKNFKLVNVTTIDEAASMLSNGNAKLLAGGTDLLGGMKRNIHPMYPETLVNIETIPGMKYIKEEAGMLKIGAQTKLKDIAESELVKNKYTALAEAARRTASPHLRRMGSIAGNMCQENRCWYYRGRDNYFDCKMKGGKKCFAPAGDNRYHSIFGGVKGCMSVNPSDTAPALIALNAKIVTNKQTIEAENFWAIDEFGSTVLEQGEMVIEIQIPEPEAGTKSAFVKFANRDTIDFAIVNCAAVISPGDVRICLNGVHPNPYRALSAEEAIKGQTIDEATAEAAGEAAVSNAKALSKNKFKIQIAKTMVKRAILACK